jgi:hypothetical protein
MPFVGILSKDMVMFCCELLVRVTIEQNGMHKTADEINTTQGDGNDGDAFGVVLRNHEG